MIDRTKHVKMINTPDDWPMWPTLPLKTHDGSMKTGIILAYERCYAPGDNIVVWHCPMFMVPTKEVKNSANEGTHSIVDFDKLTELGYTTYKDAEAIVDGGWIVD